ncbi:MAG TPA: hypothetical protein VGD17_14825 [Chitinophagaceae bacterium]
MEFEPHPALRKYPFMQFLFHSVIGQEGHTKYYNIYKIDDAHYFAECHHFNRERSCEGDFELHKEGDDWTADTKFEGQAQQIGEEIDRMQRETDQGGR